MAQEPGRTEIVVFAGQYSAIDPHTLQPGQAVTQVNLWSPREGQIVVRSGLRLLQAQEAS